MIFYQRLLNNSSLYGGRKVILGKISLLLEVALSVDRFGEVRSMLIDMYGLPRSDDFFGANNETTSILMCWLRDDFFLMLSNVRAIIERS